MSLDDERLKNLLLFKVWATDDELANAAPTILIVSFIVIAIIAVCICW